MPTTQFSRRRTRTRRNAPALCGMSGSMLLNSPVITLLVAHARDSLIPASTQSMLSRRSSSTVPCSGSIVIFTLIGMPSGSGSSGSWRPWPTIVPAGISRIAPSMRRSE